MNYEQYHQKGGTYVIPVEVFDNLLEEKEELEQEKQETISFIRKELSDIEIELITPKPDIYDLGLLRGRYGTYKEILSKLDVLKITEKSDK